MIGLSDTNPNTNWTSIDYAIYIWRTNSTRNYYVYENGTLRFSSSISRNPNDIFSVERNGTTIRYYRNGTVFYTSTVASTTDLYVDTAIYRAS